MSLSLRRTVFLDSARRPDDYEGRYGGCAVGRILRLRSTGRELWHWTQTFDEAKSASDNFTCARAPLHSISATLARASNTWALSRPLVRRAL
jgi:hypothetical protein